MGGGGGGHTTSTVTQSNLPEYAQPYYESLMKRGFNESNRPYQPYQGERLAGPSAATERGLGMAERFAQSGIGSLANAQQYANQAARAAGNFTGYQSGYTAPAAYQPGQFNNSYTGPQGYQAGQFNNSYDGPAAFDESAYQVTSGSGPTGYSQVSSEDFSSDQAQKYMSPYMQDVVDRAKGDVRDNTLQEQVYRNSKAAASGAFGGSRAAVQNQLALNAAQDRMMDLDVEGRQAAFENAQQQFERDRAARMQAQQANQGASLEAALANQNLGLNSYQLGEQGRQRAAELGLQAQELGENSRQFGYSTDEQARQRAAQLGLEAQQLGEQSRQFGYETTESARQAAEQLRQGGAQLGLAGIEALQGSAGQLADLQSQQDQMMLDRIKAQLGVGQTNEDYSQEQLDLAYEDFVNQRDSGRQNLQFLSSLLQGVPISANQDVTTTTPTNPIAGGLGSLAGLQALYGLGRQG